jgi:hypothetical protein
MNRNQSLFTGTLLLLSFLLLLNSCTTTLPSYEPESGDDTWIHLDGDTLKDIGFYIDLLNDQPGANAVMYKEFGDLNYYKSIEMSLDGLQQDTVDVTMGEAKGVERWYYSGADWNDAMRQVIKTKDVADTTLIYLSFNQRYRLSLLPEKLQLKYRIVTRDTAVVGITHFVKTETETTEVMRWH